MIRRGVPEKGIYLTYLSDPDRRLSSAVVSLEVPQRVPFRLSSTSSPLASAMSNPALHLVFSSGNVPHSSSQVTSASASHPRISAVAHGENSDIRYAVRNPGRSEIRNPGYGQRHGNDFAAYGNPGQPEMHCDGDNPVSSKTQVRIPDPDLRLVSLGNPDCML
jgi:hypothetical protein